MEDSPNKALWSFSSPSYAAYPAAVKREIKEDEGGVYIHMNIHCEATKEACDQLARDFEKLNASMKQAMSSRH